MGICVKLGRSFILFEVFSYYGYQCWNLLLPWIVEAWNSSSGIVFFSHIGFQHFLYPDPKIDSVSWRPPSCNPLLLLNTFYCGDRVWGTGGYYVMFSLCLSIWRTQWAYLSVMWLSQAFVLLLKAWSLYHPHFFLPAKADIHQYYLSTAWGPSPYRLRVSFYILPRWDCGPGSGHSSIPPATLVFH